MNLDPKELDAYITREDPRIGAEEEEMTPYAAIQTAIFDLCRRKWEWRDDPEKQHAVAYAEKLIAALELAQWELTEYRKLKAALAVLRNAVA